MAIMTKINPGLNVGNWSVGKHGTTIVSDQEIFSSHQHVNHGGINDVEYFGGSLVCESVLNVDNARLIAKAPEMYALLNQLVHSGDEDELGCIVHDAKKILKEISKVKF